MGMVYFKTEDSDILVTMGSETSIEVSKSNKVTNSSVMSGRTVGDDLIEGNFVVNVQGVVSYSKSAAQKDHPTPEEWEDLVDTAIANKRRFTLYSAKYKDGQPLLKDYQNVVIADYGYTVDEYANAIKARIVFQEVFVTNAAKITTLSPVRSTETKPSTQDATKGGKGTSTKNDEEYSRTIWAGQAGL